MEDFKFNVPENETVGRERLIAFLNTSERATPAWAAVGRRVEDSNLELDWSTETSTDILGNNYTDGKKSIRTQTFDPWKLSGKDQAQMKIWNLGIKDDNVHALLNQDMLIAHFYAAGDSRENFAERYTSCSVLPTSLGGEGGGSLGMSIEVTYGGERTLGTVSKAADGSVTFTPETEAEAAPAGYSARSAARLGER